MDPSDEELNRKFTGLQMTSSSESNTLVIPVTVVSSRDWALSLRVKVYTDRMVFDSQFEKAMRRTWHVDSVTTFKPTEKGSFIVDFGSAKERERVLEDGPWFYRQDLVAVASCEPSQQLSLPIDMVEMWVQFHSVQMDSLNKEGQLLLARKVGTPLSDPICSSNNGGRFFKV